VRCLWAVLPAACLWGVSFPLALGAVAGRGQDAGRLVGGVYAANTVGAIVGALGFSMFLVPYLGTVGAQRILIALSMAAAVLVFLPLLFQAPQGGPIRLAPLASGVVALLVSLGVAGWFAWNVHPAPWGMVAYGRQFASWTETMAPGIVPEKDVPFGVEGPDLYCTYVGEGMNVSVAVTMSKRGVRSFHGAGKVQASNEPQDMRLQRMLGHLSALLHKKPEKVLVVACGAGVTAGTFVTHPDVQRVVICDIEPLVPTTVTPMFSKENYGVVDGIAQQNPHTVNGKEVEVVYDDGRHFIRTTKEKFDIITSDPIDPWVKGCAALNTVEYYQMCKDHLNPGGVVSLWIPLYESNLDTAKSVISTFFKVFPNGILWSNDSNGSGYDAVLFGMVDPIAINVDELQERIERPDHAQVKESLEEVGFGTKKTRVAAGLHDREAAVDLLATFAAHASQLDEWSRNAQINWDRNLRLQYLAGMWLNTQMSTEILSSIFAHYRFPENTFFGSQARIQALKKTLEQTGRKEQPPPLEPW
jgi:spermidine synthase